MERAQILFELARRGIPLAERAAGAGLERPGEVGFAEAPRPGASVPVESRNQRGRNLAHCDSMY